MGREKRMRDRGVSMRFEEIREREKGLELPKSPCFGQAVP
jgi:hypothetical protein